MCMYVSAYKRMGMRTRTRTQGKLWLNPTFGVGKIQRPHTSLGLVWQQG